jgi:hypothetical protein
MIMVAIIIVSRSRHWRERKNEKSRGIYLAEREFHFFTSTSFEILTVMKRLSSRHPFDTSSSRAFKYESLILHRRIEAGSRKRTDERVCERERVRESRGSLGEVASTRPPD